MKQLRLTTKKPSGFLGIVGTSIKDHEPLIRPDNVGEFIADKINARTAYIHGEAEKLAGYDIPVFIDGNLGQLELPIGSQDILLMLPSGNYQCKAEYNNSIGASNCYLITLFEEPSIKEKIIQLVS